MEYYLFDERTVTEGDAHILRNFGYRIRTRPKGPIIPVSPEIQAERERWAATLRAKGVSVKDSEVHF